MTSRLVLEKHRLGPRQVHPLPAEPLGSQCLPAPTSGPLPPVLQTAGSSGWFSAWSPEATFISLEVSRAVWGAPGDGGRPSPQLWASLAPLWVMTVWSSFIQVGKGRGPRPVRPTIVFVGSARPPAMRSEPLPRQHHPRAD